MKEIEIFRLNPISQTIEQLKLPFRTRTWSKVGFELTQSMKNGVNEAHWEVDYYRTMVYKQHGMDSVLEKTQDSTYYYRFFLNFEETIYTEPTRKKKG